jgi:hypothetical protein
MKGSTKPRALAFSSAVVDAAAGFVFERVSVIDK